MGFDQFLCLKQIKAKKIEYNMTIGPVIIINKSINKSFTSYDNDLLKSSLEF